MSKMRKLGVLLFMVVSCVHSSATAEENARDKINELIEQGHSVTQISPIFGQVVQLASPKGFRIAFEKTSDSGNLYIRELVLEGETVEQWSQMVSVSGVKRLAANPNVTLVQFAGSIAVEFKHACLETFSVKGLGQIKISAQDAIVGVAGCGTVPSGVTGHSESALFIAIKGSDDYYNIKWAERGPPSSQPIDLGYQKWADRFKALNPIRICLLVPGEAPPYPNCINQN
jgi:hypothetical protein